MKQEDSTRMNVITLSKYLGCSPSMVRKLIRTKAIPFYRVGNKILFEKSTIDWWISNQYKKEGFNYEVK